jgi:hypothetical protein
MIQDRERRDDFSIQKELRLYGAGIGVSFQSQGGFPMNFVKPYDCLFSKSFFILTTVYIVTGIIYYLSTISLVFTAVLCLVLIVVIVYDRIVMINSVNRLSFISHVLKSSTFSLHFFSKQRMCLFYLILVHDRATHKKGLLHIRPIFIA